jgi:hypothetical protein
MRPTFPIQLWVTETEAVALWRFPAARGHKAVTLRARIPLSAIRAALVRIAEDRLPPGSSIDVGAKFSLRAIGRGLAKVGKSKAFRALLIAAGDAAKLHPAIAMNPAALQAINAGQAAIRVKAKADAGDPVAQSIVARAEAVHAGKVPRGAPVAPPNSHIRRIQRYIVTLGLEPAPSC